VVSALTPRYREVRAVLSLMVGDRAIVGRNHGIEVAAALPIV
jgi:hypothetical protein